MNKFKPRTPQGRLGARAAHRVGVDVRRHFEARGLQIYTPDVLQNLGDRGINTYQIAHAAPDQRRQMLRAHDGTAGPASFYGDLTRIEAEVVQDLYPRHDGLLLCPQRPSLGLGDEYVQYFRFGGGGKAGLASGINPQVPQISGGNLPSRDPIYTLLVGYSVPSSVINTSNRTITNASYIRDRDTLCRRALLEFADEAILNGTADTGIRGFLGDKAGTVGDGYSLNGAGGGDLLKDASGTVLVISTGGAQSIAEALVRMVNDVWFNSGKQVRANRLALSDQVFKWARSKRLGDNAAQGATVLQYIYDNSDLKLEEPDIEKAFVSVTSFNNFYPAKGTSQIALDVAAAYRHDTGVVRVDTMEPQRIAVVDRLLGQEIVWGARFTPALWIHPVGCLIKAVQYNAS